MMNEFYLILISVILSYFITQSSKIFTHKNLTFKKFLFGTGGMPSAHTAAIIALPLSLYLTNGLSNSLVIAIVLAILIIRDAMGVRYAVGVNAKVLHKKFPKEKVILSNGHQFKDVIVGALMGIVITLLVFWIW